MVLHEDAKVIVVACNTASALGIPAMREKFATPIIGVIEPGARAAVEATKNGRIGVIADFFNLLNDSRVIEVQDRDNGDFDLVTEHNIGRRFRLGLWYEF